MEISALAKNRVFLRGSTLKGIVVGLFALVLLAGSACVNVIVHVRTSGGGLTGMHCKLQRPLTNQHQQTNVWCWAASAHTVIEYLKNQPIKQCELLNAVYRSQLEYEWDKWVSGNPGNPSASLDPPNCCMKMPEDTLKDPNPPEDNVQVAQNTCYQNGFPEAVFRTPDFYTTFDGVEYDWSIPYPHGLNWAEIVGEICANRPMIDVILYSRELGGGGHAVVVGGYSELEDGSQWVHVYDPGYNTEEEDSYIWPYDVYLGDPGVFTHVRNYKHISVQ